MSYCRSGGLMSNKFAFIFLVVCFPIWAENSWIPPTERYLTQNSLEDVKYNLRLDYVTMEFKPLFDKAVAEETLGFSGYYGASGEFRVYQDLIRIVFEEALGISVPEDFHFLAVPLYPERFLNDLDSVCLYVFDGNSKIAEMTKQLLPINLSLYANHKTMGYCPVKNFSLGIKHVNTQDLHWLFNKLELDPTIIERAFSIGNTYFGTENRVLLQLFDMSHERGHESYQVIDRNSYPAWPGGYPYQNRALSDYALNTISGFPPQFFLLLTDHDILNPHGPIVIKRCMKVQPSKIKAYEQELRSLIKAASYNTDQRNTYLNQLKNEWYL